MPVKKIDGVASFEEIEKEVSKENIQKSPKKRNHYLVIIVCLLIVAIGLFVIDWVTSRDTGAKYLTGSITGIVVNNLHTPVAAEVFVLNTEHSTLADAEGFFLLSDLPVGNNKVIIAWQGMGKEILVTITPNETLNLGLIKVEETRLPPD